MVCGSCCCICSARDTSQFLLGKATPDPSWLSREPFCCCLRVATLRDGGLGQPTTASPLGGDCLSAPKRIRFVTRKLLRRASWCKMGSHAAGYQHRHYRNLGPSSISRGRARYRSIYGGRDRRAIGRSTSPAQNNRIDFGGCATGSSVRACPLRASGGFWLPTKAISFAQCACVDCCDCRGSHPIYRDLCIERRHFA